MTKPTDNVDVSDVDHSVPGDLVIPPIRVYGDLVDQRVVISKAMASLIIGLGRMEDGDQQVLVPYVELALREPEDEDASEDDIYLDSPQMFSKMITHENAAFVVMRLCDDFKELYQQLGKISTGGIRPEPARLRQARVWLESARDSLDACLTEIDGIISHSGAVPH